MKTSSVWSRKNGKETGKTISCKKVIKDGKVNEVRTEDYLFPNGEHKVTRTVTGPDGKVEKK